MKNLDKPNEVKDISPFVKKISDQPQLKNKLKKSTTVNFLRKLYTYPPKFELKLNDPHQLDYKKLNVNNNSITKEIKLSKLSNRVEEENYPLSKYLIGLQNKTATLQHIQKKDFRIENLSYIPVYGIFNGSNKIVLAKPTLGQQIQLLDINQEFYSICGSFADNKLTRESKLGFFFLDKTDAENYMKEVIIKDKEGVNMKGISINCISLFSAYKLMRSYHPNVDFRFIPNIQDVISLTEITDYIKNTKSIFTPSDKPLNLIIEKINNLEKPLTFTYWDYLANIHTHPSTKFLNQNSPRTWSGVPVYLVDLKINEQKEKKTIVFLYKNEAQSFLRRKRNLVKPFNGNYGFESMPIKNSGMKVASLENFLEFQINYNDFKTVTDREFLVYLLTDKKPVDEIKETFLKGWGQNILRKYRTAKSFCSTVLYK